MNDQIKQYEVLIFDWDGTLMDSRADIVGCLKQAITATGYAMPIVQHSHILKPKPALYFRGYGKL